MDLIKQTLIQAIFMVIVFSAVPLVFSSVTGLLVAVLQSATQVQEQTVTYLVKFISICIAVYFLAGPFFNELIAFVQAVLGAIITLGRQ